MRLKSFTAKTLPEAMARVREALGADAVILSSQPAEDGRGVRITAALEDCPIDEFAFSEATDQRALDGVSEALSYHRVPAGLYDRLIGAAATLPAPDSIMALAGALDSELGFAPLPGADAPRPVMLVGQPGAGKTACAAKLCARARLAGAGASLITMDVDKSGGLAQACAFAGALAARLAKASDIETLAAAVADCPEDHFVVIDTAGANPFDSAHLDLLTRAAEAAGADPFLVVPAGSDAADCAEAAIAFARSGARGMIATRLDVARRLGGLLSASHAGKLDLVAVGNSPRIGDGLLPINPVSLARLMLDGRIGPEASDSSWGTG